jgi:hypothetical protein
MTGFGWSFFFIAVPRRATAGKVLWLSCSSVQLSVTSTSDFIS